jgi:CMP-N,N'-diacetyllegionaminic acid synthase
MNVAIIPIRSRSKGLKNKNILKFKNEKYLINYVIKKIIKLKIFEKIYILTDSNSYKLKVINNKLISTEYFRPKKLSKDTSKVSELLDNFIDWHSKLEKKKISNLFLFQVTSPLWNIFEIKKCILFFLKKKINSLFTVTQPLQSPISIIINNKNKWKYLIKKRNENRQNYKDNFFFINGVLFAFSLKFFNKYKKIYNNKTYGYEISKQSFADINDIIDYNISRQIKDTQK